MLNQFIELVKTNDTLQMVLAFSILVILNFIASMWYEIKNKDLTFSDIKSFITAIVLNVMFLFGVEVILFMAKKSESVYYMVYTLRTTAWVGVATYYGYGFYQTLKKLGFKSNPKIEKAIKEINESNTGENEDSKEDGDFR